MLSFIGYGVALSLEFETNPISDNKEDYKLTFKMDPVELSYQQVIPCNYNIILFNFFLFINA